MKDHCSVRSIKANGFYYVLISKEKRVGLVRMIEGLIYKAQSTEMWVLQVYKISSRIKPQRCGDKSKKERFVLK